MSQSNRDEVVSPKAHSMPSEDLDMKIRAPDTKGYAVLHVCVKPVCVYECTCTGAYTCICAQNARVYAYIHIRLTLSST